MPRQRLSPAEARRRVRRLEEMCPAPPEAPTVRYAILQGDTVTVVLGDGTRKAWPADDPLPRWTKVYGFDPENPGPVEDEEP